MAAKTNFILPDHNGLKEAWNIEGPGTTVYVNPPFGRCFLRDDLQVVFSAKEWTAGRTWSRRSAGQSWATPDLPGCISDEYAQRFTSTTIADWVEKCSMEKSIHGCEVLLLAPAATDTAHFQKTIFPKAAAICFIKGRLQFLGNTKGPAPMPTCVAYFGARPEAFRNCFANLGRVVSYI